MIKTTKDNAKAQLDELIAAALRGEDVYITLGEGDNGDAGSVQLVAVAAPFGQPQFGSARGLIWMSEDFDDPIPDFDEYQ